MGDLKRNHLIDLIKGLLILLVIVGHFLPGTLSDNPARYAIYSFHMPAFFYISGMLYSGHTSLKQYGLRLGIPWLVAVQVYYVLLNYRTLSFASYLRSYVVPYYYLWFVVGFLFCVIVIKLCKENKLFLLILSIILSFLSVTLKGNEFFVWKFVNYTIRPQYLIFFTIGLFINSGVRENGADTVKYTLLTKNGGGGVLTELLFQLYYSFYFCQLDTKFKILGGSLWLDMYCYA